MFKEPGKDFHIRLSNVEGVPVVGLMGMIGKASIKAVDSTLKRLAEAGHYNVMLNVAQASADDWGLLGRLGRSVRDIRGHYGTVDLITGHDKTRELLRIHQLKRLFRICRSERQAIFLIKKLGRQPERLNDVSARLLEQS